ncbi:MAG TPA: two-component regulator propeller domain-containing protein [Gammaproteobacteria bacterium]|nr:two-component regulator propeller domain-containing protein [Gammaproteobacteria bacterium]
MTATELSSGRWRSIAINGMLLLLGATATAAADAPPLILEHLTTSDGLPQGTVMTTLQDSQGFVWLGTEDGLVRYDGRELHRYARSRGEPGSLPGNYVWQIVEDAHSDLWIAVEGAGLARWDRRTDRFTSYRHDPNDPSSLASDRVRTVAVDRNGLVWIGTFDAGVDVLDPTKGSIEHLRHDPGDADSLASDHVSTLALDRAGNVWIGTDRGLSRRDAATGSVSRVGEPQSLGDKEISSVIEDQTGTFWVGSFNAGLVRIDRDGHVLETFRHDSRNAASLGSDDVRALLEDEGGRLWVGTANGLGLLDRGAGTFSQYRHDANDGASLRDSFVMSLYQDPAGLVWIGTRNGGVSRWNPRSWELGGHRPAWLEGQPVFAFADAPDNRVWIASLGGLVRFDAATGTATSLDAIVGRDNALGDNRVSSLRRDRRGALWIGTMGNGLKVLTPDGKIESIPVAPGDPHSLSAAGVMAILESRSGAIWIGTYGGGANVLDPATGTVRQLPYGSDSGAVSAPNVTAIAEDAHGNIWLGTEGGGLDLARADGTVIQVFRNDPANASTLPANTVYALAVDADGRVWAGTDGGGLARVVNPTAAPGAIEFQVYSRYEGLSSDTLYGVVPDARGRVWLSGNAGLMRLDPATGAVKTYHREHGLQGEEYSFGAYFRLRDGRVCFGGPGGFNIFDPAALSEEQQPPRVALTSVEVLGVRAAGDTPFWLRDRVDLDYRGTILSLDFGVLDFTSPAHNRLAYRMVGLTGEWIDLGTQRRVTLTNLDPGDHVLEVRAASADSIWSAEPLKLTIHRDPAPWASPMAYAAYALALLGFAVQRIRRHRRKFEEVVRARERLEAEVGLRTRELRESNLQLAEAAQAKSNFLDRMSHELRTPMNGVVGMTELLSRTTLSPTQSHLTKTIRSSAQILLQIVNDLLDLSKIRAGKVSLEALPIDLGQVLEECTSLFAGAAEAKGIELVVCPPPPVERLLLGDPLRVRQILMNLVGNAVKFTEQGEVVVRADIEPEGTDRVIVRLAVADTGVGMDAAHTTKIFEPFAQADETTTRRFGGTGLGLAICRELADLMGGHITVESQPRIGSTFHLSLPLTIGAGAAPQHAAGFGTGQVCILSRRPSLTESLARHASSLGLTVLPADSGVDDANVILVDASSHANTLASLLAPRNAWAAQLVVIATAAEVEARQLRALLPEVQIVLKPVHRIALHEALAAALGTEPLLGHEQAPATAPDRFNGHVLLVEDEPVNAAVAEGYLAELGCTCVWVESGTEAVARTAAERFDLILMDLNMPGIDGFATAALIRRQQSRAAGDNGERRVPIVALTAHDAAHYRDKCLAADIDDILSKPYTLEDCTRLLRRWLVNAERAPIGSDRAGHAAAVAATDPATLASVDASTVAALRELRRGGHTDLYARLVELFRTSSTQSLAALTEALALDDLTAAAAVCHKLASAAANVGALAFGQQARELERHCLASERASARESCQALQAAHAPLLETLQGQRLRATG